MANIKVFPLSVHANIITLQLINNFQDQGCEEYSTKISPCVVVSRILKSHKLLNFSIFIILSKLILHNDGKYQRFFYDGFI